MPNVTLPVAGPRPIGSIVVGTDFTPCSAVAIAQALRIARWAGAAIHVVHIIDAVVVVELEAALSAFQQNLRDNLADDARRAWTEFAAHIPGAADAPVEVSIDARIHGILEHARRQHADLLVIGAFGDRRPDVGFGTVATACVRRSSIDVLLVRDSQTSPFRTVVAAVDFSPNSARALERAAQLASMDGSELHVLHCFCAPWHELHYRAPTPLVQEHEQRQYRDAIERRLAEFVRPVTTRDPALRVRTFCLDDAGHRSGIVEHAQRFAADLIVLGTRGRSNLRDMFLGTTAEKVLKQSSCSVLAVKPDPSEPGSPSAATPARREA